MSKDQGVHSKEIFSEKKSERSTPNGNMTLRKDALLQHMQRKMAKEGTESVSTVATIGTETKGVKVYKGIN